jgi:adenylate kinase
MIIFLGIAGSGKTEQSKLLANQFNFELISVGELLRNIPDKSLEEQLNKGDLIEDSTVISVVEKALKRIPSNKEFIIDGFPRTLDEATWLSGQATSIIVIHLMLSPSIAFDRLKLRNRSDDNTDAITRRINEYNELIDSILNLFKSKGFIIGEFDGSESVNDIHEKVVSFINKYKIR